MNRAKFILVAAAVLIIGGGAGVVYYVKSAQRLGAPGVKVVTVAGARAEIPLPDDLAGYGSVPLTPTQVELDTLPADTTYGRREYRAADGFRAQVSVVLMGTDRTSIHKPQFCLTGQGWQIDKSELVKIPMARPQPYDLEAMRLTVSRPMPGSATSATPRGIYLYWFVTDGQRTAGHFERTWSMAVELLRHGVLQRWAYISCFAVCLPGEEEATYTRMRELLAVSVPEFQVAAPRVASVDRQGP